MFPKKVAILLLTMGLLIACGGSETSTLLPASTPEPPTATLSPTDTLEPDATLIVPAWRYVNSGWLSPYGVDQAAALTRELRAFVITNQRGLDDYEQSVDLKRSKGTAKSLERANFSESILLAAYYLWRPLQGDPLSVVGFSLDGNQAEVLLELEDSPQGKEYPFLFAPMAMVAVERSQFPQGEPVDFTFYLNGEPMATIVATVE